MKQNDRNYQNSSMTTQMLKACVVNTLVVLFSCIVSSVWCLYGCDNPNGIPADSQYCYVFHQLSLNYSASWDYCAEQSGQLPVFTNLNASTAYRTLLQQQNSSSAWIGAQATHLDNYDWFWISDMTPTDIQGCYLDKFFYFDLPNAAQGIPDNLFTDTRCIEECRKSYKYAGVQDDVCYCGDSYGKYGLTTGCSFSCPGDSSSQRCGAALKSFIYFVNGTFAEFTRNQPNELKETCAVIDVILNDRRLYADEYCHLEFNYICHIDVNVDNCPSNIGYISKAARCYFVSDSNPVNWFVARGECIQRGGDLVKISSEAERAEIQQILNDNNANIKHWIGLTKLNWKVNNTSEEPLMFADLAMTAPESKTDNCMIASDSEEYRWLYTSCDTNAAVVCQYNYVPTTAAPVTTPEMSSSSSDPNDNQQSTFTDTQTTGPQSSTVIINSDTLPVDSSSQSVILSSVSTISDLTSSQKVLSQFETSSELTSSSSTEEAAIVSTDGFASTQTFSSPTQASTRQESGSSSAILSTEENSSSLPATTAAQVENASSRSIEDITSPQLAAATSSITVETSSFSPSSTTAQSTSSSSRSLISSTDSSFSQKPSDSTPYIVTERSTADSAVDTTTTNGRELQDSSTSNSVQMTTDTSNSATIQNHQQSSKSTNVESTTSPFTYVTGQFKLYNREYNDNLANKSTIEYSNLRIEMCNNVISPAMQNLYNSLYKRCASVTFSQGSIVVDYEIELDNSADRSQANNAIDDRVEILFGPAPTQDTNADTNTASPNNPELGASTTDDKGPLTTFQIVLIVSFVIIAVALITCTVIFILLQKKKQQVSPQPAYQESSSNGQNGDLYRREEEEVTGSTEGLVLPAERNILYED